MKLVMKIFMPVAVIMILCLLAIMWITYNPPVKPEEVGSARVQGYGPMTGYVTLSNHDREDPNWHSMPMWVQNDESGKPMWGYVLVENTNAVRYLKEDLGMHIVSFGNFADQRYYGTLLAPFYAGSEGYWDPIRREYISIEPKKFFILVSLSSKT